jgi:PAS domain S-box-containing protein
MIPALSYNTESDHATAQLPSVDAGAISRLRSAVGVAVLAEIILPAVEVAWFLRPDWLAIEIQAIWLVFTLVLLVATWHPRFDRIWRPSVLLLAIAMIVSSGTLSIKGATLAPFMFLLVLLPPAGTILPWEPSWQVGMSSICLVFGLLFSTQFDWQNHLVVSGLSALVASILGSNLVCAALTKQRISINTYLQNLARSEEKFHKIFEMSRSVIAIHSIPDGCLVDVNTAWERTFGYSRQEVLGKMRPDLGSKQARDEFVQWVSSLKVGDAGLGEDPEVFESRQGNSVHCVYSWSALELDGRACVLVVGQDITARVQAEEELRRNREVLLNQERLKAVGELASGIAHDLNNSLNALRLRVELLCADSTLSPRHNESLQLISRIVRDAGSTIGRLQDFARRRHDRPVESVNLNAVITQSVEIAKSTLEEKNFLSDRSIRVEMDVPGLPLVLGDPGEMRQIFLNLLLNAQDAMPVGGTIRITGRSEGEAIVIRVEDEGEGIPPEHLNHVFDPFFSTKGEGGTGLGLSIAYGAMSRIGGSIFAANRAEGGAVFTLSFPLAHAQPIRTSGESATTILTHRVLVADDDPPNLHALSDLLESKGHTVIRASSAPEALEILLTGNSQVETVFCDLGMPLVNGWQIAQRVKSLKVPPAFYLVTGWGAEIPADDPRRRLVDGIITKPVDPKILDQLVAANDHSKIDACEPIVEGEQLPRP